MLQNLPIIKLCVKKIHLGVELWLHKVLNLGTIWGSDMECGKDSFVMNH